MASKVSVRFVLAVSLSLLATFASPARAGVTDVLPDGTTLLYAFTGVWNDNTDTDLVATWVSCTNVGTSSTDVTVQLYNFNSNLAGELKLTIPAGGTEAWVSQDTGGNPLGGVPGAIIPSTAFISAGSGRIVATGRKPQLLCTAQLVNNIPENPSMTPIPLERILKVKVKAQK